MELHNRQTREEYQLSPSAREILAIIEGADQPLEPSVIAERLLSLVAKIQQAAIQASPAPPIRDARRVPPDRTVNTGT